MAGEQTIDLEKKISYLQLIWIKTKMFVKHNNREINIKTMYFEACLYLMLYLKG